MWFRFLGGMWYKRMCMVNLVIVSNRLPISVRKVDGRLEFCQSMGGLATGLASYTSKPGTKWIGWPGIASDALSSAEKLRITRHLKRHRCYPVFLTQKQIDEYYNGYSNSVLWPVLHELPLERYPKKYWQTYQQVNKLFSDEVLRLSKPGSTIWVHDYQLMLVPKLLRGAARGDKIGHFLHVPFPPYATLEQVGEARSLLEGLLGADLAGFHTRRYTRNFLEACDALLGTSSHQDFISFGNRTVRAMEFPIGIDYDRFAQTTQQTPNRREVRELRKRYSGQKIILTVDRLDPSKGLLERMRTYQQLLRRNADLRGKVVLVMIVAPSRTDVSAYQKLKQDLDQALADITTEFATDSWQPVDFIYEAVPLEEVMNYYQVADVAFIAPIRDGMNLVAKEYLASKPRNDGVLVLSKTAGAAEELRDAIQVDPSKPRSLVHGLKRALNLPKKELRARAERMRQHIEEFSVQRWATNFVDTLALPTHVLPVRTRAFGKGQASTLAATYHKSNKRLLLLDYDGVLREFVNDPAAAKPTPAVRKILKRLSENSANDVVVISGRSKQELDQWFGHMHVALAAEHGAFFRRAGGKKWHRTSQVDPGWKKPVKALFDYYASDTPGALVEQKNTSLVWHYRAASPYHAQKSLVAIRRLLKPLLKRFGLTAKEGNKIMEVHPADISKGRVAQEWLIHDHDFVLAIGDDITDEDMFAAVPAGAYSIKVGRGQTAARFRVKNVAEVVSLLNSL